MGITDSGGCHTCGDEVHTTRSASAITAPLRVTRANTTWFGYVVYTFIDNELDTVVAQRLCETVVESCWICAVEKLAVRALYDGYFRVLQACEQFII